MTLVRKQHCLLRLECQNRFPTFDFSIMITTASPKVGTLIFTTTTAYKILFVFLLICMLIWWHSSPQPVAGSANGFNHNIKTESALISSTNDSNQFAQMPLPGIMSRRRTKKSAAQFLPTTSYRPLDSAGFHPLSIGMVNVSDNHRGYRISSGNNAVKLIAIRFDKSAIPDGYTVADVHTYFYSDASKDWIQLKRDSVDLYHNIVYSANTEDGDYINAIIKSPESPETAGFAPTTLHDLKLGDPTSMVNLIQAPIPNSQGSATLSFHIETPVGRQDIQPNLDVSYNSDGGNGVMGEGWSLTGTSSISVETRWGVPTYSAATESETYLLDGQMLAMADDKDILTMAHRKLGIARAPEATKRFFCRRETNFSKIERVGSLKNYIWVVTDKNGTKYYYGGIIKDNGSHQVDAVLREGDKIAEWKLRKVIDLFKNSMEFTYEPKDRNVDNNVVHSLYLSRVLYTLYQDQKHLKDVYKIDIAYDDQTERSDFNFSARYGFFTSDNARLLKTIHISSVDYRGDGSAQDEVNIRKYAFHYRNGSYSKMILDSISQFGYDGDVEKLFYGQRFDYYSLEALEGNYFTDAQINMPADDFLGKSETQAKLGFGGATGIGAPDFQFTSKSLSFDARFSYKENESESVVSFIDIDGDARPDIIRNNKGRITYRPNTSSLDKITFGPERPIAGISSFGKDDGSSHGIGGEVNGPTQSRIYGGTDRNTTHSYSKTYFTDANGDGLTDVVEDGQVKFNTYDGGNGGIQFTASSAATPSPISSGATIGNALVTEDQTRMDQELANNIKISPLHDIIKVWIAPDSGTLRINAPVRLLQPVLGNKSEDSTEYNGSDGVYVSVQRNSIPIFNPLQINRADFSEKAVVIPSVRVSKGDKILFRVQSGNHPTANGYYDQVQWNPVITYLSKDNDKHFFDPFKANQVEYSAVEDHLYCNEVFNLPDSGTYTIAGRFVKPRTKDTVTLTIRLSGKIVTDSVLSSFKVQRPKDEGGDTTISVVEYKYTTIDSVYAKMLDTSAQVFATNFAVPQKYGYNSALSFAITPASNFDMTGIDWKPQIRYQYYDSTEQKPDERWKKDTIVYFPKVNFKGQLYKSGIYVQVKDSGDVKISPIITLNSLKKGQATLVVSDKDKVILRKQITESAFMSDTVSFVRNKGERYSVHYEVNSPADLDVTGANAQTPSYLLIPNDFHNWVVPQSGRYSFYSVQKRTLARSVIQINGKDSLPHNRDTLDNVLLKENDVISFIDTVTHSPVQFSTILSQAAAVFHNWETSDYGALYRGWGHAVFNATNYLKQPIDINKFQLSQIKRTNFYETEFFAMPHDVRTLRNTGVNKRIYIHKDTLSPSRMAMADVTPQQLFIVNSAINASGARAVVRYTKSTSTSIAGGGAGVSVNKSINGNSVTYSEYIDLNGDRFPDIAGTESVQFTNSLGGLQRNVTAISTGLQHAIASSWGINLGGVFFHPFIAGGKSDNGKGNNISTASSKIAAALSGLSGGYNENSDEVEANLYDVNGDGLPDKVNKNGNVYLNQGNGFSGQTINWQLLNIQKNESRSLGGGGGYNFDNYSASAGISLATTTTKQYSSLIDFNGDGLIDNVVRTAGNDVIFYINTGKVISRTGGQVINLGSAVDLGESVSSSRGIHGAYTFAPHVFVLFVPVCKIVFSVTANTGDGNNSVKSQWIDINGDGFVDFVSYDNKKVTLKLSNLAKVNRLKNVSGPLGGSLQLDYKHIEGDYRHPGGKWVMASVTRDDGVKSDGENFKTEFDYKQGHFDRYEREFLGFHQVIAADYFQGKLYRRSVAQYNNQHYFVGHQIAKKWTEDAAGNKFQYEEYDYEEKYRSSASKIGETPPPPQSLLTAAVMQSLLRTKTVYSYEGDTNRAMLHRTRYKYDNLLNISSFEYEEGNSASQKDKSYYKTAIIYKKVEDNPYIYGLPTSIVVTNKAGETLKKVEATYPLKYFGPKMESETVYFSDKNSAKTTFRYDDETGNLIKKIYANGLRDTFEIEDRFGIYVSRIKDPYELENRFEYDYRFGTEKLKVLTSGFAIKTKYDEFGRVVKVQGPHQNSTDIEDSDHTIKIAYHILPGKSYSILKHFDESNQNDGIYTVSFVDGFGKNIQTKKTGVVNGTSRWIVSGRQFYDDLYRVARTYYPSTQNYDVSADMTIGAAGTTLVTDTGRVPATVTNYDILDRELNTYLPNGQLFEANRYKIGKDGFNNDAQLTITTYGKDANLNKREVYTNGANLVTTEKRYPTVSVDSIVKVTKYQYTPIHLTENVFNIHDGRQYLVMSYKYDWGTRKVSYFNVNGGTTTYEYDKVGNLKKKMNARRDVINYDYEHRRLIRTNYSSHPEDSVRYVYGVKSGPQTTTNAGRIVFQIDATGAQSFMYDVYGNVVYNTRTIIAPFDTTYTFTTKFRYDSWGRLLYMVYPSGEKVNYNYNIGGNLIRVYGSKYGTTDTSFRYANNIFYDEFEQRKKIEYGNGLVTNYSYEDTLRRLQSVQTLKGDAQIMLSTYRYDELNNIRGNTNKSNFSGHVAVTMEHGYAYDNQNQLMAAEGKWNTVTKYDLKLAYDDQFNVKTRKLELNSAKINRSVSSKFEYEHKSPFQLSVVTEHISRIVQQADPKKPKVYKEVNTIYHSYDDDGNDVFTATADSFHNNINERKILWDQEDRIRAISSNGYLSSYSYDADGERTIKISNEIEGVYINGQFAGDYSIPATYNLYVNPYFSVRNARGIGTKHIYIGRERIVSQLTNYSKWPTMNTEVSTIHPEKDTLVMTEVLVPKNKYLTVSYLKKMLKAEALVNSYFDSLQIPHRNIPHNALTKKWPVLQYPVLIDPNSSATGTVNDQIDGDEKFRYFYHRNHIGSSSFISDKDQNIVQYVEYLPFGETFMELRRDYSSQFTFNGKEQDPETGLYYYGARYYDPHTYQWLGIDPMAESYAGTSPYSFNLNNPITKFDPEGRSVEEFQQTAKEWGENVYEFLKPSEYDMALMAAGGMAAVMDGPLPFGDLYLAGTIGKYGLGKLAKAGGLIKNKLTDFAARFGSRGTTTVFRAVSQAEVDDIMKFGLRAKEGAYETGKLFAPTLKEAAQFGKNNFQFDKLSITVMKVKVPNKVLQNAYQFRADGMNAISIPADKLHLLKATPLNYSPWLK
ncbi:SpvB/TcaC N-terminal domain-containing protein [Chitinophaga filiformis]|uniref:Insecticide toxin TcdB middle/N-terminal domain-containing protein n=1 Tax=Chitinophaga filiformis TaxID=104663 RepID=A0ABY4HWE3_CHIFI|nr:SpvB/TcaC N-terminal domain-containing protein [Chitinophaga filiformis]UPK67937.1 hypothetical protein MYF79_23580 [Chitinophaga filiformis]